MVRNIPDRQSLAYTIRDLGVLPGYDGSCGYAINNAEQIVVIMFTRTGHYRSFLWQDGKTVDIGALGGGVCAAWRINQSGEVVGRANTSESDPHAFLWASGKIRDLGTLGGSSSYAIGVNNKQQVVGCAASSKRGDYEHSFLWQDGTMQDLNRSLPGSSAYVSAINDKGNIVGSYSDKSRSQVFLYSDGKVNKIPIFGGSSMARDINNSDEIVGYADVSNLNMHAFLYREGKATDLGTLGGNNSSATQINAKGQIIGDSNKEKGNEEQYPFLWEKGRMVDLNTLLPSDSKWTLRDVYGINDKGQIVGEGIIEGKKHGFLLSPNR